MTYYTTKETAVINVIAGVLLVAIFATPAHCQTTASETAGSRVSAESLQQKAMIDARTAWDKARDAMKATREALDRAEYAKDDACAGRDERSLECRSARARVETAKAAHGEAIAAYDRAKAEVERAEDALEKVIEANARAARKAHDERYARMQKAAYPTTRAYAAFLARIYPKFNNISAEFDPDSGLLTGYHSFFTRYAFDIGPQGPAVARWIAARKSALKRLGVAAVGVSNSEAPGDRVHYDVK